MIKPLWRHCNDYDKPHAWFQPQAYIHAPINFREKEAFFREIKKSSHFLGICPQKNLKWVIFVHVHACFHPRFHLVNALDVMKKYDVPRKMSWIWYSYFHFHKNYVLSYITKNRVLLKNVCIIGKRGFFSHPEPAKKWCFLIWIRAWMYFLIGGCFCRGGGVHD